MRLRAQLAAKSFGCNVAAPAHRKILARAFVKLTVNLADQPLPLPLRDFVFTHPKPFGQRHVNLRLVITTLDFIRRAAHAKATRRTPDEFDAANRALIPGFRAGKRFGYGLRLSLCLQRKVKTAPCD